MAEPWLLPERHPLIDKTAALTIASYKSSSKGLHWFYHLAPATLLGTPNTFFICPAVWVLNEDSREKMLFPIYAPNPNHLGQYVGEAVAQTQMWYTRVRLFWQPFKPEWAELRAEAFIPQPCTSRVHPFKLHFRRRH